VQQLTRFLPSIGASRGPSVIFWTLVYCLSFTLHHVYEFI